MTPVWPTAHEGTRHTPYVGIFGVTHIVKDSDEFYDNTYRFQIELKTQRKESISFSYFKYMIVIVKPRMNEIISYNNLRSSMDGESPLLEAVGNCCGCGFGGFFWFPEFMACLDCCVNISLLRCSHKNGLTFIQSCFGNEMPFCGGT